MSVSASGCLSQFAVVCLGSFCPNTARAEEEQMVYYLLQQYTFSVIHSLNNKTLKGHR